MSRFTRRIIFYTLVFLFLFGGPLLIVHSLGYSINFTDATIQQTGGIFIKSKTARLSLSLNGTFIKETSRLGGGALLTDISPGTYIIRIEKLGFSPWMKSVDVTPGVVTELRNVVLAPQHPEPRALLPRNLPKRPTTLSQSFEYADSPFFLDRAGNLRQQTSTTSVVRAQDVHSFAHLASSVFFIENNGFLAVLDTDTNTTETIARPGFYLTEKAVHFFPLPEEQLVMIDSAGGLFSLSEKKYLDTVSGEIKEMKLNKKEQTLLLQGENELRLLWIADNPRQPFERKKYVRRLIRIDEAIEQTDWFHQDSAHILFSTPQGLFFSETDGRGGTNTFELASGPIDDFYTTPDAPSDIFYKQNGQWFKLRL